MTDPVDKLGRSDLRPINEDEAQKLPAHIHYKWAVWTPDGRLIQSGYVRTPAEAEECIDYVFARLEDPKDPRDHAAPRTQSTPQGD